MNDKSQFESARLKVKRAYRHIDELKQSFADFLKIDFCALRVSQDPNTGQASIYIQSVATPPPETALTIGDIVHNLRAALDHTIVEILGERGNRESFPVAKEQDNPGAHPTYRLIKETLPDLAAFILEKIQIYDTGTPSIWAVSKLDNIDKHNLLIPIVSVQQINGFSFKNGAGVSIVSATATILGGGRLNVASIPGPLDITNKGQAAAQILFGNGQPLEGRPVIDSLVKMAELTSQAIEALEAFWLREDQEGRSVEK
jgi:hypothetical protein